MNFVGFLLQGGFENSNCLVIFSDGDVNFRLTVGGIELFGRQLFIFFQVIDGVFEQTFLGV